MDEKENIFSTLGETTLQCSACELVAARVQDGIAKEPGLKVIRGFKEWSHEARRQHLRDALGQKHGCPKLTSTMQVAQVGKSGARIFVDWGVLQKQAQSGRQIDHGLHVQTGRLL